MTNTPRYPRVRNVRADELTIGAVMLYPDLGLTTVSEHVVHSIELVGDDITINNRVTTSRGNLVTIVLGGK